MEFCNVETLVNVPWDWSDFRAKLLFNSVQSKSVIVSDQVDSNSKVPKPSASANPMEVGLSHLWEVEVDDDVDGLNVNTPGE